MTTKSKFQSVDEARAATSELVSDLADLVFVLAEDDYFDELSTGVDSSDKTLDAMKAVGAAQILIAQAYRLLYDAS